MNEYLASVLLAHNLRYGLRYGRSQYYCVSVREPYSWWVTSNRCQNALKTIRRVQDCYYPSSHVLLEQVKNARWRTALRHRLSAEFSTSRIKDKTLSLLLYTPTKCLGMNAGRMFTRRSFTFFDVFLINDDARSRQLLHNKCKC